MKTWDELDKRTPVLQKSYNDLVQRYSTLQAFQDAREWDNDAGALIHILKEFKNEWVLFRQEQADELDRLKQEHDKKSFFSKALSSRSDEREIENLLKQVDAEISGFDPIIDKLSEMMDNTPADKSEQKEMADMIREFKSEFTLLKREVNENLRQTRATARAKTADWTGVRGGVLGSVARYQRTSIRMEKERALVPMENQKAFIEKKLISLDRQLKWIMHFIGDGKEGKGQVAPIETTVGVVQRCNYCGRKVDDNAIVCSGCGAVI